MNYYVGIDNSSLDHRVRIIDDFVNIKLSFTIANNLDGFEELHEKLSSFENVKIGFELPHGPLVDFLSSKKYQLYSLNPLKIKRFKESLKVSGNKNDNIDALAIAQYLRHNQASIRPLLFNSPEIERLKTLSVVHTRLTHNRARHINKLRFCVRQYFPLQEELFSAFGGPTHLKMLIKYPTFESLQSASDEEIKDFLIKNKYCRPAWINKILEKSRSFRQYISQDVVFAYRYEAICLAEIIMSLNNNLREIEKEMASITEKHTLGKCMKSLPGAGVVLSAKILALFGDNKDRFDNANGAQCLFGTAPKNYQSGPYHKVIMRKACNKSARAILYQYAFSSLKFSSWAREYYDNQKSKGKTHSVAIRALSNKWVNVIFALWKKETFYCKNKENDKKNIFVA